MVDSLDSLRSALGRGERACLVEAPWYAGDVIAGRYRLEALIAEGGMGLVFRAHHLILDQPIALKLVKPTYARHPIAVARFLDEARAIARLKSPHVVHVFDSGTTEDGTPYMALELLLGLDLHAVLERDGPLPFERAAGYVEQACRAVAEAHSLGIVHRDLKPENLFLHQGEHGPLVKVLDFGISKHLHRGDGRALTVDGETLGSPHYMAPEQMAAKPVDPRSDIWSLGVVLFELVTGRVPFDGENVAQVYAALFAGGPPSLSDFRSAVPPEFARIVDRCLRKEPAERYADVGELADALAEFSADPACAGASYRPTMISVAPGVEALQPSRVSVRRLARRRSWNPGWVVLALMGGLVASALVVNAFGGETALSLTPSRATSVNVGAALAGSNGAVQRPSTSGAPSSSPNSVGDTAVGDTAVASLQVAPQSAQPVAARAVARSEASPRVVSVAVAPKRRPAQNGLGPPRQVSSQVEAPRKASAARTAFDELIPPYEESPGLRAEANGSQR